MHHLLTFALPCAVMANKCNLNPKIDISPLLHVVLTIALDCFGEFQNLEIWVIEMSSIMVLDGTWVLVLKVP